MTVPASATKATTRQKESFLRSRRRSTIWSASYVMGVSPLPLPARRVSALRRSRQARQPLDQEIVEALGIGVADEVDVRRPLGHPPVVGDRHAEGERACCLDGDVDRPAAE